MNFFEIKHNKIEYYLYIYMFIIYLVITITCLFKKLMYTLYN